MSDPADRERLQQVADHYQRLLDEEHAASEQQGQPIATAAEPTVADDNDVAASTETATDSEQPTSGTSEQPPETD
jgi:hypothetical protein